MPKENKYKDIEKAETLISFFGGLATKIYNEFKSFNEDTWIGSKVYDGKEGHNVTKLNLTDVCDILRSPGIIEKQYGIEVPKINNEEINKISSGQGMLLDRNIGKILSFCSEVHILDLTKNMAEEISKGSENARRKGYNISRNRLFNIMASSGGGSGSSLVLPHCSTIKSEDPNTIVNMIVPVNYISDATPQVIEGQTIKNNMKEFIEDVKKYAETSTLDRLVFRGLKNKENMPVKFKCNLPDHIFWLYGFNAEKELIETSAQLIEDISGGIPFSLTDADNIFTKDVNEKGIIVSINKYIFPRESVKTYIINESLKYQLKSTVKQYQDQNQNQKIGEQSLRLIIDTKIKDVYSDVIDLSKEQRIKNNEIKDMNDLEDLITKIEDVINKKSEEFKKHLQDNFEELKKEIEKLWKDGRLDETKNRIDNSMKLINESKKIIEGRQISFSEIEEIKNRIGKFSVDLNTELNKNFWKRDKKKIFQWTNGIISSLKELESKIRTKSENDDKLSILSNIIDHLNDTSTSINTLKENVDNLFNKKMEPPQDQNVKIDNNSLLDLVRSSYQFSSLDFDKIKEEYNKINEQQIEEKMKKSFVIRLSSLSRKLKNPREAYRLYEKDTTKKDTKVAIVPDFAVIEESSDFEYLVKRDNYWNAVSYHFLTNISADEVLKAFKDNYGLE